MTPKKSSVEYFLGGDPGRLAQRTQAPGPDPEGDTMRLFKIPLATRRLLWNARLLW